MGHVGEGTETAQHTARRSAVWVLRAGIRARGWGIDPWEKAPSHAGAQWLLAFPQSTYRCGGSAGLAAVGDEAHRLPV